MLLATFVRAIKIWMPMTKIVMVLMINSVTIVIVTKVTILEAYLHCESFVMSL